MKETKKLIKYYEDITNDTFLWIGLLCPNIKVTIS